MQLFDSFRKQVDELEARWQRVVAMAPPDERKELCPGHFLSSAAEELAAADEDLVARLRKYEEAAVKAA